MLKLVNVQSLKYYSKEDGVRMLLDCGYQKQEIPAEAPIDEAYYLYPEKASVGYIDPGGRHLTGYIEDKVRKLYSNWDSPRPIHAIAYKKGKWMDAQNGYDTWWRPLLVNQPLNTLDADLDLPFELCAAWESGDNIFLFDDEYYCVRGGQVFKTGGVYRDWDALAKEFPLDELPPGFGNDDIEPIYEFLKQENGESLDLWEESTYFSEKIPAPCSVLHYWPDGEYLYLFFSEVYVHFVHGSGDRYFGKSSKQTILDACKYVQKNYYSSATPNDENPALYDIAIAIANS